MNVIGKFDDQRQVRRAARDSRCVASFALNGGFLLTTRLGIPGAPAFYREDDVYKQSRTREPASRWG